VGGGPTGQGGVIVRAHSPGTKNFYSCKRKLVQNGEQRKRHLDKTTKKKDRQERDWSFKVGCPEEKEGKNWVTGGGGGEPNNLHPGKPPKFLKGPKSGDPGKNLRCYWGGRVKNAGMGGDSGDGQKFKKREQEPILIPPRLRGDEPYMKLAKREKGGHPHSTNLSGVPAKHNNSLKVEGGKKTMGAPSQEIGGG